MQIEKVSEVSETLFEAFQRLVPQLTRNNPPPSWEQLATLVSSQSSTLLIAREEGRGIVGAACVIVYPVPTGLRAVIEDVVVDRVARGRGLGEALVREALEIARVRGAASVTLTSNPKREEANRLYQRMGFTRRETNAYVYKFG